MKEISWTEFKALKLSDIKLGACVRVTGDNDTAFYAVIKPEGAMIAKVEAICSLIDSSKGR